MKKAVIVIVFCTFIILSMVAADVSVGNLRSLVLKPGSGVLVKCNSGVISTEEETSYQVLVWCNPSLPPTNTPTSTPQKPTNTPTNTPVVPTNTPTNTPLAPTNTPTNTPQVPTSTPTNTPVIPTNTPTNTPIPGGKTYYLNPGQSFSGIAASLAPGDLVILRAGKHDSLRIVNVHGTKALPITVTGELNPDGSFATIISYVRVVNSKYINVFDFEIVNSPTRNGIEADPDSPGEKETRGIVFRNMYAHDLVGGDGNGTICLQLDNEPNTIGVFDILVENFRCKNNAPRDSSRDTVGVYMGDWPGTYPAPFAPIDNVVLRDIYLEDIGTACVDMKPNMSHVLVERLTCIRSGDPSQTENGVVVRGTDITFRDCLIQDVGIGKNCPSCWGFKISNYDGWIVKNAVIENNTVRNGTGDYGINGSSIYYNRGYNVISRGNTVTGFNGHEYWGYPTAADACDKVGQECQLLR